VIDGHCIRLPWLPLLNQHSSIILEGSWSHGAHCCVLRSAGEHRGSDCSTGCVLVQRGRGVLAPWRGRWGGPFPPVARCAGEVGPIACGPDDLCLVSPFLYLMAVPRATLVFPWPFCACSSTGTLSAVSFIWQYDDHLLLVADHVPCFFLTRTLLMVGTVNRRSATARRMLACALLPRKTRSRREATTSGSSSGRKKR
jgi:hypothetical protein